MHSIYALAFHMSRHFQRGILASGISLIFGSGLWLLLGCSGGGGSPAQAPPPPAPQIASFTASRATIDLGETLTLRPMFSNGRGAIQPGFPEVTSAQDYPVSPRGTTTYVLTVTNTASVSTNASVTVAANPRSVTVSGSTFSTFVGRGEQYVAEVTGIVNQNVAWTLNPGTGASISATGGFLATAPGTFSLKVASQEDPGTFTTKTINVLPAESSAGSDSDLNGIRDDVDQLIRAKVSLVTDRTAMEAVARTLQSVVTSNRQLDGDYALYSTISSKTQTSMGSATMPFGLDEQVFAQTFNTLDRVNGWVSFLESVGGQVFPEEGVAVLTEQPGTARIGFTSTETSPCIPGYVIVYLNGVLNNGLEQVKSINEIKRMIGTTYNGQPVRYRRFNNPSDCLRDFIESYKQLEISNPSLRGRWDFFWSVLGSQTVSNSYQRFINPTRSVLITALEAFLRREITLSQPEAITTRMAEDLENLYIERNKVLIVAHSQGNLFASAIQQQVGSRISDASWGVIDVANVSRNPPGVNITIHDDFVVTLARLVEPGIPAPTVSSSTDTVRALDFLGHSFLKVYTNPAVTRTMLKDTIHGALNSLQTPVTPSNPGLFTVALVWNTPADIDLHVFEPDGTHVYYLAPNGQSGSLDRDDTGGTGPEHYSLSCDPAKIQTGIYRIGINYYRGTGSNGGSLTLRAPGRSFQPHSFTVATPKGSGGNANPTIIFKVKVDRLPDGTYVIYEVF